MVNDTVDLHLMCVGCDYTDILTDSTIEYEYNGVIKFKNTEAFIELINSEKSYGIIEQNMFIEKLLSYLDNNDPVYIDKNSNKIKSALYILSKILINKNAKYLNDKYKIIEKMCNFFDKCDDYSMKGTLAYITSFIALNDNLNLSMINSRSLYFSNSIIM